MAHCKDEENLQRILECPICLERIKDPRSLPCLHSFCEQCTGQHIDEKQHNGTFPCLICTLKFHVPPEGVTGFNRNLYLIQISELIPEVSEVTKCDVCVVQDTENAATSMCIQCKDHLCQQCAKYHCSSKFTVGHRVVSLEEVRNGQHLEEIRQFQQVQCPKHAKKTLEIYCENCVKPLCLLCAMLEHKHHELKNVEEAAAEVGDVLQGLLKPWTVASDHSTILSAERKKVLDSLQQEEERLINEIKQMYSTFKEDVIAEIDVMMTESIDELQTEVAKARKQADVAYNEAELSRMTIASGLKYAQEIMDSTQDVEKLQQFQDLKTCLENLDIRKRETEVTTPVFELQPVTLAVPNLMVKTGTKIEKERVTSGLPERTRQPVIKERAMLMWNCCLKLPGEKRTSSYGLTVNDDWLITSDMKNRTVKVFDRSSGSLLFRVDQSQHKLQQPRDVTCSNRGDIFVTDEGIMGVVRYNSKGQVMKVTHDVLTSIWSSSGITCHKDQLVVTDRDGGRVLMADFDCNINKVISRDTLGLSTFRPDYVCVDNEGHLVVGDSGQGRVHVIDTKQSAIIKTFSDKLGASLRGVCVDERGHILVADYSNNQVVLMSGQSEHARVVIMSDDVSRPTGLAVTGPGEVAVLEESTGNVKVFKYADI